jgi:hypothetical protein
MKKIFAIAMMMTVSAMAAVAQADGFECQTQDSAARALTVKVYDNTTAEAGTRNAAVLVLSDPAVAAGRKTIARFTDVNSTLANSGATYVANVDLRFNDSGRKGELIGGTKLGELDQIVLDVAFSFAAPVEAGDVVPAKLTLIKRNGDEIELDLDCARYLKN